MIRTAHIPITFLLFIFATAGCESGGDSMDTDTTDSDDTDDASFAFDESDASAYSQVDRVGMPAVVVALIASKDAYNASNPADDAAFADEIVASVTAVHDALDDDLEAAGLTPCAPATCVEAAAPLVIPDMLSLDTTAPAGFPNGRRLSDPVMDVTLALLLLDLDTHPVTTLAELPLNPPSNDVEFDASFPYLATAQRL